MISPRPLDLKFSDFGCHPKTQSDGFDLSHLTQKVPIFVQKTFGVLSGVLYQPDSIAESSSDPTDLQIGPNSM